MQPRQDYLNVISALTSKFPRWIPVKVRSYSTVPLASTSPGGIRKNWKLPRDIVTIANDALINETYAGPVRCCRPERRRCGGLASP